MRVKDIMTTEPRTCTVETSAAAAAALMWEGDCGILPVLDAGKLAGIVTDRDLFIALATQNRLASDLPVGEVATRAVITCDPDDDIHVALAAMRHHRIRRLPVVGFGNTIFGIVSMDDVVRAAGPRRIVSNEQVVEALKGIYGIHHDPQIVAV